MKTFFDYIAPHYEKFHCGARQTFRRVSLLAGFRDSDQVLDLGGGTGRISQFLVGLVKEIIVVDPSEKMIRECGRHSGLICRLGSGEAIPLEDSTVDKVLMVDAFHHIQNQTQTLSEIKRVLKPDGLVIFEEFNPRTFGGRVTHLFEKLLRLGSRFHTPQELARLFAATGFQVRLIDGKRRQYYLLARKSL